MDLPLVASRPTYVDQQIYIYWGGGALKEGRCANETPTQQSVRLSVKSCMVSYTYIYCIMLRSCSSYIQRRVYFCNQIVISTDGHLQRAS